MLKRSISDELFKQAKTYIPGGVNSPVRAYKAVGGNPLFIKRAKGSFIYDVDGNKYIDYVMSWGALILGHAHPEIISTVKDIVCKGVSFGAPTEIETRLARKIVEAFPEIDLIRFVNSGTEAVMSAIRLARAYTQRDIIIKFEGCYHGHVDSLLVKAGSGVATLGIPDSCGIPKSLAEKTIVLNYNDIKSFKNIMKKYGKKVACVIIEPVAGNMGVIPARLSFLRVLRKITKYYGSLLIFDEVISGFRLCYGGAQTLYEITPDLSCFGKIIGGGLPVGAFGGRRDIMNYIAPLGPTYQAGTLSGNPVTMASGLHTLKLLSKNNVYALLENKAIILEKGFKDNARKIGVALYCSRVGSMLSVFFTDKEVHDYTTANTSNRDLYAVYFREMLKQGIYLPPSQFESMFLSLAHTDKDLENTVLAHYKTLQVVSHLQN